MQKINSSLFSVGKGAERSSVMDFLLNYESEFQMMTVRQKEKGVIFVILQFEQGVNLLILLWDLFTLTQWCVDKVFFLRWLIQLLDFHEAEHWCGFDTNNPHFCYLHLKLFVYFFWGKICSVYFKNSQYTTSNKERITISSVFPVF